MSDKVATRTRFSEIDRNGLIELYAECLKKSVHLLQLVDQSFHGTGIQFKWLEKRIAASNEINDLLKGDEWYDTIVGLHSARITHIALENDTQERAFAAEMKRVSSETAMRAMMKMISDK